MRAYFKNDLYTFASHREREKQLEAQRLQENKAAQVKKERQKRMKDQGKEESRTMTKPVQVDDCLTLQVTKKENEKALENNQELAELMKSMKKRKPQEEGLKKNVFSSGYKPRSSLVVKAEPKQPVQEKSEAQERKERKEKFFHYKKMEQEIKKVVRPEETPKAEDSKPEEESPAEPEEVVKTKKIKKQANYQRLDLKRKYKDRFIGGINANLRKFTRNGRLKLKYRAQSELNIEDGEAFNSYISSLSKSLKLTLSIDDSDEEHSETPQQNQWMPPADPTDREQLTQCLRAYFGFENFREGQFETIQNILNGKSTLFISETASGKSLTYILSAMLVGGFCMVISPLVSLMLDQLQHLPMQLTAACVSSLLRKEQQKKIAEKVKKGEINILFLTPEALQTDFLYHLEDFPEAHFVCVDEAHSLSELSHNFRTSFLTLAHVILNMVRYKAKRATILGLTATANPETVASVVQKLQIEEVVRSSSCMNKNLFVTVSRERGQLKYESLIRYLNDPLISQCQGILVYTRTRKIMGEVFNYISNSVSARVAVFHGALSNKEKTETLQNFRKGIIRVVVATVALGMGLDFENLQCVVHVNIPKSIQNYVQEIGRAGRRQRRAYTHLFLDENDYVTERNYIISDQIQPALLTMIYQQLRDHSVVPAQKEKKKSSEEIRRHEELVIKRTAIIMEQCLRQEQIIYEEDEEQLESVEEEQGSAVAPPVRKVNSQLFAMRIQKLVERTQLKQEAILTLILKVEYLLRDDQEVRFKVLPTSNQLLKIGFFKQNETEVKSNSDFFRKLVQGCKKVKGCIYVPLVEKCNQLQLQPVQLLTKLYRLKDEYWLRVQQEHPIFVWQFEGRRLDLDQGIDHELGQLVERGFDRLMGSEFIGEVVEEMRDVQSTALVKLNALWSLAFLHSRNHITNVLHGHLLPRSQPIPANSLPNDLDKYFKQDLNDFYQRITSNGTEIYIPTSSVQPKELSDIYDCICMFFKHEMSTGGELRSGEEVRQARRKAVEKYEDGKSITKILMGVTSGQVSWKIYGERSYWMAFKLKNYSELLEVVREQIQRYKENHKTI